MEIIHSYSVNNILHSKLKSIGKASFITLEYVRSETNELLKHKGIAHINLYELSTDEQVLCEKEYIENISSLSSRFRAPGWWANPVSEKNEHLSSHYKNLCEYYSLIKTLQTQKNTDTCLVIICNKEIYEQLSDYCKTCNIKITSLENPVFLRAEKIKRKLFDSSGILLFFIKSIIKKIYTSYKLGDRIRKELKRKKKYYVIRTWLHSPLARASGNNQDTFFGILPDFLRKKGHEVIILANISTNYFDVIRELPVSGDISIVPEEHFIRYSDLIRSVFYLRLKKKRLDKNILLNGVDVTRLYEREINRGYFNTEYLKNIQRYFIAKRVADEIMFDTYIQPFENYGWEKTTILGLREKGATGKIFGFQHAFISRNSFKYFPGKEEREKMPLPDRIITMGKVTKEIMQRYGHYSRDIFTIGCALRQQYLNNLQPFKRQRHNKVVVPLTMVKKESLRIINFLYQSGLQDSGIEVVIRCHPAAPFETFKEDIGFIIPENFIISNKKRVKDELADTDIVLYTWTTVAIEALKMGLPVIYLDILRPMYVDPLFECDMLTRSVKKPEELYPLISDLYNMDDSRFFKEQQEAQVYLQEYFSPVSDKIMGSAFIH